MPTSQVEQQLLLHLLALVGVRGPVWERNFRVCVRPERLDAADRAHVFSGGLLLAVRPADDFCSAFQVRRIPLATAGADLKAVVRGRTVTLRTLHAFDAFAGAPDVLLRSPDGAAAWAYVPLGRGGAILCGTELAADLQRFRQGDPAEVGLRPNQALWGIAGERPLYLFERQLQGLARRDERQADVWAVLAADCSAAKAAHALAPILPHGAPGAVVLTGDDDQAQLEKYAEQLRLLDGHPITYFLHPLTRHTRTTLDEMRRGPVELGIHPDALDAPARYSELLVEQCRWFRDLTGEAPRSLRNHGFLNDGYWGHLPAWLEQGIRISSNLPGLDGRPLGGSFLPARLAAGGGLQPHWSVVTSIGDGIRYIDGGCSEAAAARCIHDCADAIRESGIPGVMVLNLHPQNVGDTRSMHLAALEVVRSGFVPWSLQQCLAWFEQAQERRVFKDSLGSFARWFGARRRQGCKEVVR